MVEALNIVTGRTVPWLLETQAGVRGDRPFFHWEPFSGAGRTYRYGEVFAAARALAAGLQHRGVKKGDLVLLHMNNCPEFLFAWHACAMIGAIAVTTNPRAAMPELDYFIGHSEVRCALTQPALVDLVVQAARGRFAWIAVTRDDSGEPAAMRHGDALAFDDLCLVGMEPETVALDEQTPLSVQYTSGTTARPKGVVWTHGNAVWGGYVGAAHNQLREDDVAIVFTPLCHTNAMSWAHFPALWSGSSFVLQPSFSASRFWPMVQKHDCTWANVIPFAVQALAARGPAPEHRMRHWVIGAANVGPIEAILGTTFVGAWGMTEIVTHGTFTPPFLPSPALSMGAPVPELDIAIFAPDGGPTPTGEAGLLKVRGVPGISLFKEYLNDPEATAASFADGWFDTGDRVRLMEHGHLRFVDRAKDMIKVGAENVAASEIEAVIATVVGVTENAVVARPDPMRDEVPVAFVRAQAPCDALAERILTQCREQLAEFKVPVEVRFLDEFPRAELNKVAKAELRKMACTAPAIHPAAVFPERKDQRAET